MPILARSCDACISARRRCDRQTPRCERCKSKRLICAYKNEPATNGAVNTSQSSGSSSSPSTSPDRADADANVIVLRHKPRIRRTHQSLRSSDASKSWPPSLEDGLRESNFRLASLLESLAIERPSLASLDFSGARSFLMRQALNCIDLPVFPRYMSIDLPSTDYIVRTLRSYPANLAESTASPVSITHPILLRRVPPQTTVAQIFVLCREAALPTTSPSLTTQILAILRSRVAELVSQLSPKKLTTEPLLLATQALILAAITLYLDPESLSALGKSQHAWPEAQKTHFNALHHCNRSLWDRAPWDMPDYVDESTKWLMGESIRRTLIVSLILPDVLLNLNNGAFVYTGFVSILPFDSQLTLWEKVDDVSSSSAEMTDERGHQGTHQQQQQQQASSSLGPPRLLSYRELVMQYATGTMSDELAASPFIKFLLSCCLGCRAVSMPAHLEEELRGWMQQARTESAYG